MPSPCRTNTTPTRCTTLWSNQVRAVLEHRLEQLNIAGVEIAFPEDRQTVVVTPAYGHGNR